MIDISIIIPCYNSQDLVENRVREFEMVFTHLRWSWEILLCDDGSSDGTADVCRRLAQLNSAQRRFIASPVNRGLGANVSAGIRESRGRFVGYADADSSTPAVYVLPIMAALSEGFEVAEAHRAYHYSPSYLPFILHRLSAHYIYAWLVGRILGLQGHDTLSGFKFFRREAALKLLDITRDRGWFWDTEMVANAHHLGYRVADIPSIFVRTPHMFSTVHLVPDSWRILRQLLLYKQSHSDFSLKGTCCSPLPLLNLEWATAPLRDARQHAQI